jgi:PAS domain-containing protein
VRDRNHDGDARSPAQGASSGRLLADVEAAFEAVLVPVLLVDAAGRVAYLNTAAVEMFGYRREELLDEQVEVLVPAAARAGHAGLRARFGEDLRARPMGRTRSCPRYAATEALSWWRLRWRRCGPAPVC